MRSVIHTRRGGPWFRSAIAAMMAEAGFVESVFNGETASDDVIFADYYKHSLPVSRGVLLPLNESLLGIGLGVSQDQSYHFFAACRDDLTSELRKSNIRPSCEIRPPWTLTKDVPGDIRPICLFFPSYGNWDELRCIAMAQAVADAMAIEVEDLSPMTFVLDVSCELPRPKHGQKIVRSCADGSHLWYVALSSIFVCMGSPYIAECSFGEHLQKTGLARTQVFAENLMTGDVVSCVDEMIEACVKANSYSDFKMWCLECTRVRDSRDMPAFIDLVSHVFGSSGNRACCVSFQTLLQMLGKADPCDRDFIRARQERANATMVDKLLLVHNYFQPESGA